VSHDRKIPQIILTHILLLLIQSNTFNTQFKTDKPTRT